MRSPLRPHAAADQRLATSVDPTNQPPATKRTMLPGEFRLLGRPAVAITGSAIIGLTSVTAPLPYVKPFVTAPVSLLDNVAEIMGGSGHPIPSEAPGYLSGVMAEYIDRFDPGYTLSADPNGLFYPAELYPVYAPGVKSEPFDNSVATGLTILNDTINQQVADGNNVAVFGHSQSSTISSLELNNLDALPADERPDPDQLHFVMTGDPNLPDGGFLTRFEGLDWTALGITFSPATPADTPYTTDITTLEYDGFADFPKYPLDILSDVNAALGIEFVHPYQNYVNPANIAKAEAMPVTSDYYADGGETHYYMIPTENLPLLDLLRTNPMGNAIADLLQPDLKVIVNLGYGNPDYGFAAGPDGLDPANVSTGFGLFPDVNPGTVINDLIAGAKTGFQNFETDISADMKDGGLSSLFASSSTATTPSFSDILTTLSADFSSPTALTTAVTNFGSAIVNAAQALYEQLLPIADDFYTLTVTDPTYDFNLFMNGIEQGNLLDAVGNPIAANTGLDSLIFTLEYGDIDAAINTSVHDIESALGITP